MRPPVVRRENVRGFGEVDVRFLWCASFALIIAGLV